MRYTLIDSIGRGGMGEVFLAEDPELGRKVALKFLVEELRSDAAALARLRREARAAAALDHPYICKIYEFGEAEDGRAFIAMEYVEGETLAERLRAGSPPLAEALRLALEMAEALEKASERRIVHRDLKPDNVMVGRDGHAKIMDFGLAKELRDLPGRDTQLVGTAARATGVAGTLEYMAPEQLRGADVDSRADHFAFGILLHELLSGAHPFRRPSAEETLLAILEQPPAHLDRVPSGARALVERLLAKAPEERPSISAARAELEQLLLRPDAVGAEADDTRPFVGRQEELEGLRALLGRAYGGRGGLVLIGGEPGVGKTRLVEHALAEAAAQGVLVLEGACNELDGAQPYLPWIESLELAQRVVPRDTLRDALGDDAPEVAKLLPSLRVRYADLPAPIELPPEQQQRFLFNSTCAFLERLAAERPIAWMLDDLQWADESSLALLLHIARDLPRLPILIVGTYRNVELEVGKPFEKALSQLVRQRLAERALLGPLPESAVEALLAELGGDTPPPELVRAVYQGTEGNPFFVEEVFAHLSEEGKLFDDDGRWIAELDVERLEVPEGVRLVIGRRLERLAKRTREVLTAAAVVGRVFELRVIENVAGLDPDDILDAIEEAEAARLLGPRTSERELTYAFSHELIRHTLLGRLSLPRAQRLHLRIADALEIAQPTNAASIARHYYLAGAAADSEKAVRYLLRAGTNALATAAAHDARRYFETALSYDDVSADDRSGARLLADLHDGRAESCVASGDLVEALDGWRKALPLLRDLGDTDRVARVYTALTEWTYQLGRIEESLAVAREGLAVLGDEAGPSRCLLLAAAGLALTNTGQADGDVDPGAASLEEAIALAESMGDERVLARVLAFQAFHFLARADPRGMTQASSRSAELIRPRDDPWTLADALKWLILGHQFEGRFDATREVRAELEPLAERVGNTTATTEVVRAMAVCELAETGEIDAWEALWKRDEEILEQVGMHWTEHSYLGYGRAQFWRGDWDAALSLLSKAVELENPGPYRGPCRAARFLTKCYAGHADALDVLHRDFERIDELGAKRSAGEWWALVLVGEGLAVLGERPLLEALHPRIRSAAQTDWVTSFAGYQQFKKVAGITAAALGNLDEAARAFADALEEADRLPLRIEQAENRRWYASMLLRRAGSGDRALARRLLDDAIERYRAIGMPRHLALAEDLARGVADA